MKVTLPLYWSVALLFICAGCRPHYKSTNPRADLESPLPNVRAAAAEMLRASPYAPPSRVNWDKMIASLQQGMSKTDVDKILALFHLASLDVTGGYQGYFRFQLDDAWVMKLQFTDSKTDPRLSKVSLVLEVRRIMVVMPANFTGAWTNYYANGQPYSTTNYSNGIMSGKEIGYYSSGKVRWRGSRNDDGSLTGTWKYYDENGNVTSTDHHSDSLMDKFKKYTHFP